jgi:hypothetical protein
MGKKVIHNIETGEVIELEISQAEMDQMDAEQQARIAAVPYNEWRVLEYPPYTDYLDAVVKGDQAQLQAYIDACLAVKAKYPKPQ